MDRLAKLARVTKNGGKPVAGEDKPVAKYRFEQRFIDKAVMRSQSQEMVETTTVEPQTDYMAQYEAYLREYERDLEELEAKAS